MIALGRLASERQARVYALAPTSCVPCLHVTISLQRLADYMKNILLAREAMANGTRAYTLAMPPLCAIGEVSM